MASRILPPPTGSTSDDVRVPDAKEERETFVEAPESRNRSGRGAINGVLLGSALWVAILVLADVIRI